MMKIKLNFSEATVDETLRLGHMRDRCTDRFFCRSTARHFERHPGWPRGRKEAYKGCIIVVVYQVCTGGIVAKHVTAYAYDVTENETHFIDNYKSVREAKADIRARMQEGYVSLQEQLTAKD